MYACKTNQKRSIASSLGLDAFVLFKRKKMAIFFLFAMFLGGFTANDLNNPSFT